MADQRSRARASVPERVGKAIAAFVARWAARIHQEQGRNIIGVLRSEQRREDRHHNNDADNDERHECDAVPAEIPPERAQSDLVHGHAAALRKRGIERRIGQIDHEVDGDEQRRRR